MSNLRAGPRGMNSSRRSSANCIDSRVRVPVRANYVNLYKRPESDADFMRSVAKERRVKTTHDDSTRSTARGNIPIFVDGYLCRQMYLKSYTFSRKESKKARAKRCLVRVRDRMSVFVFSCKKRVAGGKRSKRRSTKKKNCFIVVGELRRTYRAMVGAIFRRVMPCGTTINTGDQHFG